jgi:ankyrin repeat protein
MIAAVKGHTVAVTLLLKKGSDVNSKNKYGKTALHFSAGTGKAEVVQMLLAHGANANERESQIGDVPIISAAASGSIETAHALLVRGANVNEKNKLGGTALMRATMNGRSEMVLFLLKNGADAKAKTNDGKTALTSVGGRCISSDAAKVLMASGTYDKAEIHKAFHDAVTGPHDPASCTDLVKFFVENGADVNQQNDYGNTALILASMWGHTEVVRFLLSKGADASIKNKDGNTALNEAKDSEIRRILKDAKRGQQ